MTGSVDNTSKIWNAKSGAEVLTLKGHNGLVSSASFSPDGTRVVTASLDNTSRIWAAGSGAELLTLKGHTKLFVLSASFNGDGTARRDRKLRQDGEGLGRQEWPRAAHISGAQRRSSSASFSPDSLRVVTGGSDSTAKVWDLESGTDAPHPERTHRFSLFDRV